MTLCIKLQQQNLKKVQLVEVKNREQSQQTLFQIAYDTEIVNLPKHARMLNHELVKDVRYQPPKRRAQSQFEPATRRDATRSKDEPGLTWNDRNVRKVNIHIGLLRFDKVDISQLGWFASLPLL